MKQQIGEALLGKRSGKSVYVPDQGDIIWIDFDPQAGHEQFGHRPAIVISPMIYNKLPSGLAIVCPITSKVKGYPFEVALCKGMKTEGAVLSDQIKSIDWRVREAKFIEKASPSILSEIVAKLAPLFPIQFPIQ